VAASEEGSEVLQKAYLEPENGARIDCMFNPARFSFSLANRWETDQVPGKAAPELRFAGGAGGAFDLDLVFDTTNDGTSVTTYTDKVVKLMQIDRELPSYDAARNSGRPPWVKFRWGTHVHSFKAVVKDVAVSYTYFSSDGLPLRANVHVNFEQFEPDANWGPQNPTSGTPRPGRSHQVQVGDTLDRIAGRYYGDPTKWRLLATTNGLSDPLDLRPGTILAIPERAV
jgi:LysM repeat protein